MDSPAIVLAAILDRPQNAIVQALNSAGRTCIADVGGNWAARVQRPFSREFIREKQRSECGIPRRLAKCREEVPKTFMADRSRIHHRAAEECFFQLPREGKFGRAPQLYGFARNRLRNHENLAAMMKHHRIRDVIGEIEAPGGGPE